MCYIDNLVMKNCKLINTTLAFEYSSVDAKIHGTIDSVLNPSSGVIRADEIKELTVEKDKVDPSKDEDLCTGKRSRGIVGYRLCDTGRKKERKIAGTKTEDIEQIRTERNIQHEQL